MRKVLPIILLIAMAICLTSCDPEAAAKLGSFMGKMGNNVYGISANMKDVDTATSAVNDAIKPDGSGNYDKNDLMKASALVDSIAKINGSSQKIEALKEDLSKPAASPENNARLRAKLTEAVDDIYDRVNGIDLGGLPDTQRSLVESVKTTLDNLESSLSATPTKADVVAVAILNEIADSVYNITEHIESYVTGGGTNLTEEGRAVVDRGLSCLETLKVITDIGNLNILGDMSASAIMDAMNGGSRDAAEDSFSALMEGLGNPIGKFAILLVDIDGENVEFSESKWDSFVFQARSIRAAYELFGCMYMPFAVSIAEIDTILSDYDIDFGLTIDDLVLYLISVIATTADDVADTINWVSDFGSFIKINFDVMTSEDPEGEYKYEDFVAGALAGLQTQFETLADSGKHWSTLSTIAVLLNDSGYKTILNMFGGSVEGVYNMFTGSFEE